MLVVLVYLNACVFIAYLVSCIRSGVYMLLNSNFVYLYSYCHLSSKRGRL
jgi:hypothetical protein